MALPASNDDRAPGIPPATACPGCGFESPEGFKFCGQCGARLDVRPEPPRPAPPTGPLAERRQLTVMFCDLVDSTRLSESLDPEELRELIMQYHAACARVTDRLGGHIAQYLGDGVMVYFGYPLAHEDDAVRAVRAGLEIVAEIEHLHRPAHARAQIPLAVRVGIHTGEVVAGEVGASEVRERLALGTTPNIAARLQSLAEPGMVVLSDATLGLVRGFFATEPLGERTLKGVSRPVAVHRALRQTGVRSRFEVVAREGLSPAVGRGEELATLVAGFHQAAGGRGRVVVITGEAGIGKSRLVHMFEERMAARSARWIACRSSVHQQASALSPIRDLLEWVFGFGHDETPSEKLRKTARTLERHGFELAETVPLMADLLSLPLDGRFEPLAWVPQRQKQATLECVTSLLVSIARANPTVLLIEDLHWLDPSTHEWLQMLLARVPEIPLLLLLTTRPGGEPPWSGKPQVATLELERLSARQTEALVLGLTGGKPLPTEVLFQLVAKTDGVPLFVEELTKMVLESGLLRELDDRYELAEEVAGRREEMVLDSAERAMPLAIPTTLKDSLMARLDRLGKAKQAAQLGAVLGREFTAELMALTAGRDPAELEGDLDRLLEAELLFRRPTLPSPTYVFKHALVQEVAYHSLLKSQRQRYHEGVARVLEARFPEVAESTPELLAHHLTLAERIEPALGYWQQAGERATARWANVEAIHHFENALELIDRLPPSSERSQRELALRASLGAGLIATRGYGAAEVAETFHRAWELCEELGDLPMEVRYGIWAVHLARGDRERVEELARWLEAFLTSCDDADSRVMAHNCLGTWSFYLGEHARAAEHLGRAMELFDLERHRELVRRFGGCGGAYGHLMTTWNLWISGFPDSAREHHERLLATVERLAEPYTLATAVSFNILLGHELGREDEVLAAAERLISLSEEHVFPWMLAIGKAGLGWALARRGEATRGMALLEEGLATFRAIGIQLLYPYYASYRAELLLEAGRLDEALAEVETLIELCERGVDRYQVPELLRLEGEIRRARGEPEEEVEGRLLAALERARASGARTLELRAAASLERPELLAEVYGSFTEGFETRDLRRARRRLEELAATAAGAGRETAP